MLSRPLLSRQPFTINFHHRTADCEVYNRGQTAPANKSRRISRILGKDRGVLTVLETMNIDRSRQRDLPLDLAVSCPLWGVWGELNWDSNINWHSGIKRDVRRLTRGGEYNTRWCRSNLSYRDFYDLDYAMYLNWYCCKLIETFVYWRTLILYRLMSNCGILLLITN